MSKSDGKAKAKRPKPTIACRCAEAGRGSGWKLDYDSGYWVHSACGLVSRGVLVGIRAGVIKRVKRKAWTP